MDLEITVHGRQPTISSGRGKPNRARIVMARAAARYVPNLPVYGTETSPSSRSEMIPGLLVCEHGNLEPH